MATTPTQIRVDAEIKKEATALFSELGLDMSSAVNLFLHQCVLRGGLPFPVEKPADPYLPYLKEADERARAGEPTMDFEEFERRARAKINAL